MSYIEEAIWFTLSNLEEGTHKELKKLEFYGNPNRSDYVQEQGWATMPGEKEPDIRVADECARRIMALEK